MHDLTIPLEVRGWKYEVEVGSTKLEVRSRRHCEECRVNPVFRKNLMYDVAIPFEVRSLKWEVGSGKLTQASFQVLEIKKYT